MKENQKIKQLQSKGIQWNTITSILVFLIQFVVSYFLNKMIAEDEFGRAIWASTAIGFGLFFSHYSWFEIFLRQEQTTKKQYATGFSISLVTNILLFSAFFFGADAISTFTKSFDSSAYLRAYSFLYLLNALALVPTAKLTKDIAFKALSQFNIAARVISSIAAIGFAILERPFLSLFFLYKGSDFLYNIIIIVREAWLPQFAWQTNYIKSQFNLASTLTFQKFAGVISHNLDSLLIGKNYDETDVTYYSKPYGVRSMPVSFIARSVSKVTFPTLSRFQNKNKQFEEVFFDTQHFLAFLLFPLFGLLFFLAEPFSIAYFDETWNIELITVLLRIFAIAGVFASFNPHFNSLLQIKASSTTINTVTISQKVLFVLLLLISIQISLVAIAVAKVISSVIDYLIYAYFSNKYMRSNYFQSVKSFRPPLVNSIICGLIAYFVYSKLSFIDSNVLVFLIPAVVYGIVYLVLAYLVDKRGFKELQKNILNNYS